MAYHIINSLSFVLSFLPLRWLSPLAQMMTVLFFDVLRLRRRLILRNLEIAFPQKTAHERLAIARESVYHFCLTIVEFLHERQGGLGEQTEMIGKEHLTSALAKGQGVYVLCIHMCSWEAMGSCVTRKIRDAYVVVKKIYPRGLNDFVTKLRQRNGFYQVERQKKGDAFKHIVSLLDAGKIVGFVMDQARPNEPLLPFFGHPAKTNTSFAAIYQKRPAPIIPAFIVRRGPKAYTLHIRPELALKADEQSIRTWSTCFNQEVEAMIRVCPEQYFWMHDRWKIDRKEPAHGV